MQRRALLMHRQFLIDTAPLGLAPVTDVFIAGADRELKRGRDAATGKTPPRRPSSIHQRG
jgi:hypothetical protein